MKRILDLITRKSAAQRESTRRAMIVASLQAQGDKLSPADYDRLQRLITGESIARDLSRNNDSTWVNAKHHLQ